jgi:hypothetical protein
VPLEDVVQAFPLRHDPETALHGRFRHPSHRSASIARGQSIRRANAWD